MSVIQYHSGSKIKEKRWSITNKKDLHRDQSPAWELKILT